MVQWCSCASGYGAPSPNTNTVRTFYPSEIASWSCLVECLERARDFRHANINIPNFDSFVCLNCESQFILYLFCAHRNVIFSKKKHENVGRKWHIRAKSTLTMMIDLCDF